jgi:hypothetical protein
MSEDPVPYQHSPPERGKPAWAARRLARIEALLATELSPERRQRMSNARDLLKKLLEVRDLFDRRRAAEAHASTGQPMAQPNDPRLPSTADQPISIICLERAHADQAGTTGERAQFDKLITYLAIALLILVPSGYFGWLAVKASEERDRERNADSATELPEQIRVAWIEALDRALGAHLVTEGDRIRFRTSSGVAYVPRSQVNVECDSRGVRLEGGGEDAVGEGSYTAPRYSIALIATNPGRHLNAGATAVPSLPVGSRSPAAQELVQTICKQAALALAR